MLPSECSELNWNINGKSDFKIEYQWDVWYSGYAPDRLHIQYYYNKYGRLCIIYFFVFGKKLDAFLYTYVLSNPC
jgi:hypothetical protein